MSDADKMFNMEARIEKMFWLPGTIGLLEDLPEDFEEFCECLPGSADNRLYQQLPKLARFATQDEYPSPEEVADALRFCNGFLFQAATPVITPLKGSDTAYMSGWGYYHTAWLYAAEPADFVETVSEWVDEMRQKDRAKAAA